MNQEDISEKRVVLFIQIDQNKVEQIYEKNPEFHIVQHMFKMSFRQSRTDGKETVWYTTVGFQGAFCTRML